VLFIATLFAPNSLYLLPYKRISGSGTPIGKPSVVRCDSVNGCGLTKCIQLKVEGQCVILKNSLLRLNPGIVVYAQWLVYGVPLSKIKKYGPATDSASWGIEAHQ
jgi:hypothetical protein